MFPLNTVSPRFSGIFVQQGQGYYDMGNLTQEPKRITFAVGNAAIDGATQKQVVELKGSVSTPELHHFKSNSLNGIWVTFTDNDATVFKAMTSANEKQS